MHCDARLASRHTHYSIVFFSLSILFCLFLFPSLSQFEALFLCLLFPFLPGMTDRRSSAPLTRCRSGTIPIGLSRSGSRSGPSFPYPFLWIITPLYRPLYRLVNGQHQKSSLRLLHPAGSRATATTRKEQPRCYCKSGTGRAGRLAWEGESPRGSLETKQLHQHDVPLHFFLVTHPSPSLFLRPRFPLTLHGYARTDQDTPTALALDRWR